jgi:hypothetical protein
MHYHVPSFKLFLWNMTIISVQCQLYRDLWKSLIHRSAIGLEKAHTDTVPQGPIPVPQGPITTGYRHLLRIFSELIRFFSQEAVFWISLKKPGSNLGSRLSNRRCLPTIHLRQDYFSCPSNCKTFSSRLFFSILHQFPGRWPSLVTTALGWLL